MKTLTKAEKKRRYQLRKIIAFLKTKKKKIFDATGLVYMTEEDYADIRKFTSNQIYECYLSMQYILEYIGVTGTTTLLLNSKCCPFCLVNDKQWCDKIDGCQYKARHGCCYDEGSTYKKISQQCNERNIKFTTEEIKTIYKEFIKE